MKFGQILVCCMTSISKHAFGLMLETETSSRPFFDILPKTLQQDIAIFNSGHLPFLIVPYTPFQKKKHWNLEIIVYWVNGAGCYIKKDLNLAQVLQIVQEIHENYCPCLYLSIGQIWSLNEVWFKRSIQKCTLSHILILTMTPQIWQIMECLKYKNLNTLRTDYNICGK